MSAPGRNPRSGGNVRNYQRNMLSRFAADYARRRAQDNSKPAEVIASPPISVELTELYARDNAKSHHTDLFELVVDTPPTPVLRRGQAFFFAVRFNRPFDIHQDLVRFIFDFGPSPTGIKETRNVIQLCDKRELTLDKSEWDARLHHQDSNTITASLQRILTANNLFETFRCAAHAMIHTTGISGSSVVLYRRREAPA
ncbi:hypothetical protein J6590_063514 [Homalodisca vitripennis]|nr:hypothetical protein J6590_063514 [Homalodisca vitripennis]